MMRNNLCWDPSTVRQVINPFAEHIPDSLFHAVHSDWALQVTPPVQSITRGVAAKLH